MLFSQWWKEKMNGLYLKFEKYFTRGGSWDCCGSLSCTWWWYRNRKPEKQRLRPYYNPFQFLKNLVSPRLQKGLISLYIQHFYKPRIKEKVTPAQLLFFHVQGLCFCQKPFILIFGFFYFTFKIRHLYNHNHSLNMHQTI